MPTYSLDTFHPDLLRCDSCGHGIAGAVAHGADPEELRTLTEDEVLLVLPGLAE
jgi:hypothetical protein